MAKIVFMKELLDTFTKEKVEQLIKIGQVLLDKNEIPYITVDMDVYLNSSIEL